MRKNSHIEHGSVHVHVWSVACVYVIIVMILCIMAHSR